MTTPSLSSAQVDRAAGVLLATACGDALGAPYEFAPARVNGEPVDMIGGGPFGWAPGEWTDDTSMAVAIAEVSATGADLRSPEALDAITSRFVQWRAGAADVGNQTRRVLDAVASHPTAATAQATAAADFARTEAAGNGSLMRTAPVALAHLHDPAGLTEAAIAVSSLTHAGPDATEACVLWCHAIRTAVLEGRLDGLRGALDYLPADRAALWAERLDHAESVEPHEIGSNGWVVAALQAAWSAIVHTPIPTDDPATGTFAAQHLRLALDAAVRSGNDTDTVAAIAGGLLGARWGASAVPLDWQRRVHGWPGIRARQLIALAVRTARGGHDDGTGWPSAAVQPTNGMQVSDLAPHPHDPGVLLGGIGRMRDLPAGIDAVVSLCRLGSAEAPATGVEARDHVEVWIIDDDGPGKNAHLDFVLTEAADTVARMRGEGRTVLVHCVQAHSRTPTVGALYAARHLNVDPQQALNEVTAALPHANPIRGFREAVLRLA